MEGRGQCGGDPVEGLNREGVGLNQIGSSGKSSSLIVVTSYNFADSFIKKLIYCTFLCYLLVPLYSLSAVIPTVLSMSTSPFCFLLDPSP